MASLGSVSGRSGCWLSSQFGEGGPLGCEHGPHSISSVAFTRGRCDRSNTPLFGLHWFMEQCSGPQEELDAGFIAHVPGGLAELKQQFERTAVGKLGVVIAEGRSPRLVVDSSISNVTSNTVIPNHMMLPRISDILSCAPTEMAQQQVIQLTLDVSKAHRRILIDQQDGGMLCFHANGQLYRCITLNFGACASGWYWGRVAGLMVRTSHSLLAYGHVLWQYVDDLLAWLGKVSCPLWASLLVVLFLILGVPMSWHKAALACEVSLVDFGSTGKIGQDHWPGQSRGQASQGVYQRLAIIDWSFIMAHFGPALFATTLIPLYRVLHQIPTTMVCMGDHVTFHLLVSKLSPSPSLTQDLTHTHQSLCRGVKLIRVANTNVLNLEDIDKLYLKSSRVWVGIQDPSSPTRTLHSESHEALQVWAHLLGSTPFTLSMAPPAHVEVTATADAMASMNLPGLGGAAFFPDGSQVWFQFQITLQQAQSLWPWVGVDMQKHIAGWELLAQFALSHCFVMRLPKCRGPITCHQGTEDTASAKGLSMTPAMSTVQSPYYMYMRRFHIYPKLSHIPGRFNIIADALSRFEQPLPIPLKHDDFCDVNWQALLSLLWSKVAIAFWH